MIVELAKLEMEEQKAASKSANNRKRGLKIMKKDGSRN